jgi:hypothetical protein
LLRHQLRSARPTTLFLFRLRDQPRLFRLLRHKILTILAMNNGDEPLKSAKAREAEATDAESLVDTTTY